MISGVLTLTAIADAEYTRLQLSTDTVVVDPYNVQTEPLMIKVEQISGVDVMPVSAYISVQALSLNHEIAGAVKDFGLCSSAEFVIPAKDMLYATTTAVRVDAYTDEGKAKLIESRTVNVTCNRLAEPMYRGDKWTVNMVFRNGDFLEHNVDGNTSIYQWSSRVEGNSSKAPWDITLTTDPEYGYWTHVTEKTLFAAKMLLAKGALIGSAVFDGDYTISQHGVDELGNPSTNHNLFGQKAASGKDKFTPNIMIDWLTGKFRGRDVDIEGKITADTGRIASFRLENGVLKANNLALSGTYLQFIRDEKRGSESIISEYNRVYIGKHPDEGRGGATKLGWFALAPISQDVLSTNKISMACTAPSDERDIKIESLRSYAIWAEGCSSLSGIRLRFVDEFRNQQGYMCAEVTRGVSMVRSKSATAKGAEMGLWGHGIGNGHLVMVLNLGQQNLKLTGDVVQDDIASWVVHSNSCKWLVWMDGKFYPASDHTA